MPRYTIWIRKEDEAKWLAIGDDRAEWLHVKLNEELEANDPASDLKDGPLDKEEYMSKVRGVLEKAKKAL